ncbi:cap-specific mRNA (nucleoside-2'-O-)-methyltransferase 1 [Apis mellifera carnica]|nr:cap-specific mRNA (nucleoside-2'-O-)-methyltransferase 1 [Apis mellifera carnica]
MRSNSDESDYENESFINTDHDESIEEKRTDSSFFSDYSTNEKHKKKTNHFIYTTLSDETSDLNESDCNEDYYSSNEHNNTSINICINDSSDCDDKIRTRKKRKNEDTYHYNKKQKLHEDSGDEGSSQNINNISINDPSSNDEEDIRIEKNIYEDSYHYNKRQKIHKIKNKIENDISDKNNFNVNEELNKQESKNLNTDKVKRMMKKMGYKEGYGLGKNKQGRLEPVEASKQHGRRGLGHNIPGLEASSLKWDPAEEEIKCKEDMEWIKNSNKNLPTKEEMHFWLQIGPKKMTIDDETQFCHEDIVRNIINSKTVFDNLDDVEFRRARTRSNPYETIRGAFFLNRAAVKMANIDRACNFMFTDRKHLGKNELLYFADVCAGPGGFSEYVLWRTKWHAKGFGFTLKNENDFKLADFYAGSPETFHPYYGPKDNGDVFDSENQRTFRELIMKYTHNKGVHFMMSDGGFSVEGKENLQEILSKQLYLCQCLVALMIVREKGHFVTKLFDIFTPFSAGLIYLMYRCFDEICIFKPNSSRPANSERYLICKSKRPGTEIVMQYLNKINHLLLDSDENNDVIQLVSFDELEKEKQFLQYLRTSNEYLGKKQIIGLCKIAAFCEDNTLVETKQADMRKECLAYWKLPDESRTIPKHMKPKDKLNILVKDSTFLSNFATTLKVDNINNLLNSPYDWFCMPCSTKLQPDDERKNATFYMSMGRSNVYRYLKYGWVEVSDINIELPSNTLVYAEVVHEMKREFRHQQKVLALHIIDAFILGGEDVSQKYLRERHELTKKFCEALWKPEGSNYARVRAKELFPKYC